MFMRMGEMQKGSKCMICKKTIGSGLQMTKGDICFPCMNKARKKQSVLDIVMNGVKSEV